MKPETVERLNSDSPEFQELRAYLLQKLDELDRLPHAIELVNAGSDVIELGYELRARWLAHNKLSEILSPLVNPQLSPTGSAFDKREYQV